MRLVVSTISVRTTTTKRSTRMNILRQFRLLLRRKHAAEHGRQPRVNAMHGFKHRRFQFLLPHRKTSRRTLLRILLPSTVIVPPFPTVVVW